MNSNTKKSFTAVLIAVFSLLTFLTAGVHAVVQELSVVYADGRLTVRAENVSLEDVLERISKEAGLTLLLTGPSQTPVTADFAAVDLEEGIRRLVRGWSSIFYYARTGSDADDVRLTSVTLLSNSGIRQTTAIKPSGDEENPGQMPEKSAYENLVEDIEQLTDAAKEEDRALYELAEVAELDENQERRLAAVEGLGDVGNPEVEKTLSNKAMNDEDAEVRAAAVEALAIVSGEESTDYLVQALKDKDSDVRTVAIESLAAVGGKDTTAILMQSMKDDDAQVRVAAVEALAEIGDKNAAEALAAALDDADEEVQETAKEALEEMGIQSDSPKNR